MMPNPQHIPELRCRLFSICIIILCVSSVNAQLVDPFVEEEIGSNWSNPVDILFEPNGTGYVVERHGLVWIIDEDGNKSEEPLIDITEETVVFGDHGLLSMALHPNFRNNGYFYVLYVVDRHHLMNYGTTSYDPDVTIVDQATIGRVTRYTADPATNFTSVVPDSRKIIIGKSPSDGFPILMASHGIGTIMFGLDGSLLISCGDAGSFLSADLGSAPETFYAQALEDGIIKPKENIGSFRAQLIDCMNGKIIRVDPNTGDGLPSNPFFDPADPSRPASRVWAYGFRNPYRFTIRPDSWNHDQGDTGPGAIYVGDVGGGLFEEFSIITEGGMNCGWPLYEGFDSNGSYYNKSIRNSDAPQNDPDCNDPYFLFQDLIMQPIKDFEQVFVNPCNSSLEIPNDFTALHRIPALVWSNEKYNPPTRAVVAGWHSNGRLRPLTVEHAESGVDGKNFEGSSSIPGFFYQGEAFPEEYQGQFFLCDFTGWIKAITVDGDEQITAVDDIHTDIRYIVDVDVNPANGLIYHVNLNNKIYRVSYGGNSAPKIDFSADYQYGTSPLTVQFDASATIDPNDDPITFYWDFGDGDTSTLISPTHVFTANSSSSQSFVVKLIVTDDQGASSQQEMSISLNNSPPRAKITSIEDGSFYSISATNFLPLQADVVDNEQANDELTYSWQIYLHHNDHYHAEFPLDGQEAIASISPAGCNGELFYYRIALEVDDGFGLKGYDEVTIHPYCGPDIIQFLELDLSIEGEMINLAWDASILEPIRQFEIGRAINFGSFERIGAVDAIERTFVDERPIDGKSVYRVRAIAENGLYQYSNEEEIEYPLPATYKLYPNPTKGHLNLEMPSSQSDLIELELLEKDGRRIQQYQWFHTDQTSPFEATVLLPQLPTGIYYYTLRDGKSTYHGSVLVVD